MFPTMFKLIRYLPFYSGNAAFHRSPVNGVISPLCLRQRCGCLPEAVIHRLLFSVFKVELLYSVCLVVLISRSVCFGEEETSVDNWAPGRNLLNHEH